MTVRLLLLGSPAVEIDGRPVALAFERRYQLIAFLALKRAWVGRAELATLLWPEQESKLAYANLRKTLHRLQSIPWAAGLESQGGALRFDIDTDVFAFDSALREQRTAEALPMRRGELLAGFDDDQSEAWSSWLAFERDRLRLAWRDAALSRLSKSIDAAEGIDLSARLLDADPLDEAALREHMAWLSRGGHSARARQVYRDFVARLRDDLGLTPGAELQAWHDSLGAASQPSAPKPASPSKADTDFIGRTVELRRISSLLTQDDCRLLTVIGPGGVGKTRLARRAMEEAAAALSWTAVFVPLDDVMASSDLGGRIARELGLHLAGRDESLNQVIEYLRDRRTLLVLDNFEQLAGDATIVQRLIESAPRLKIIVTSRVRLALAAEWLLSLEGMPYPEEEDRDHIEAFDAVRLFVQAAQRVAPALVPAAEAAAIIDICQQVEGLPLALQLAAAWTRVLSCEAIAAELRSGTEMLQAVDAAQPARHASIEAVFDHSWRLLTPVEREVLSRLSVFRGGFTAQAARAVASASLPVIGALADKSLLRKDPARIFMHPLLYQLAAQRLEGSDRDSTGRAHAIYFHRLLVQLRRGIENGDLAALNQVDADFENCRAAWRWATRHEEAALLAKSVHSVMHYCDHRGLVREGLALIQDALESPVGKNPKLEASLLATLSHFEYRLDRYVDARNIAERALASARGVDDHEARIQSLKTLGTSSLRLGRYDEAKGHLRTALQQSSSKTDRRNAAAMLSTLALIEKVSGNYDDALRLSIQALQEQRSVGDVAGEALSLNNLGSLHLERREYESAGAYLTPALTLCDRHGLSTTRGLVLSNLIGVSMRTDNYSDAEAWAERALDHAHSIRNRYLTSFVTLQFAYLALRRKDLPAARDHLRVALEIAISIQRPALMIEGVACFAALLAAEGHVSCARSVATFVLSHPGIGAPERMDVADAMKTWPVVDEDKVPWAGTLEELAQRIVVETDVTHAPLIAALRGTLAHH